MNETTRPVLVIGSLNMDLVATCARLPARGETVPGTGFFTAAGGKGANQAVAAARLGARVTMAGCIGRDAFGRQLLEGLRADGVDTGGIAEVDAPTGTALISVEASGANTIIVVPGANASCDAAVVDRPLHAAPAPGILLLQHEIPAASVAHAIRAARHAGWFTVLNPAPAREVPAVLLPLLDVIAPNESEAATLTGLPVSNRAEAITAARALLSRGARAALITLGAQGSVYCDGAACYEIDAIQVRAVDSTGAGDAYLGAFAAALAAGRKIIESLGFAGAAAALSVTRPGAQPSMPTRAELDAFLPSPPWSFIAH